MECWLHTSRALAALEQFDPDKARIFRELLQGAAEDYGIEARNWLGTPEVVTDANKYDLVRRECEEICVRKRWDAWNHLHRGWLAGGGDIVTAECKKAGLESVRQLVYDPEATQRRRAQVAASINLSSQERAALNIKLCPYCGFPVEKIEGCDQMYCGRDAHGSARFAGGCGIRSMRPSAPARPRRGGHTPRQICSQRLGQHGKRRARAATQAISEPRRDTRDARRDPHCRHLRGPRHLEAGVRQGEDFDTIHRATRRERWRQGRGDLIRRCIAPASQACP